MRRLVRNRNGSIEGMPLQIIIIVLVALAVITIAGFAIKWAYDEWIKVEESTNELNIIVENAPNGITYNKETRQTTPSTLEITLRDSKDTPINGATIYASGAGLPSGTKMNPGNDGKYSLGLSGVYISGTDSTITLTASHSNFNNKEVKKVPVYT